jgi:endonuclease V-like protein UPF0215 family
MHIHLNKPAIRVLGIAESFIRGRTHSCLAGAVMRADLRVDGIFFGKATVGGDDGTDAIIQIYESLDRSDVNALILSGCVISWFNIIDPKEVFEAIKKPVICLTYEESEGLEGHIQKYFPGSDKVQRYNLLGARELIRLKTGYEVYIRALGLGIEESRILLNKFTLDGRVPEPIRLARLAARAVLYSNEE